MQSLAPNYATMMVGRFLAGLSSAGGSVTLGLVADLWDADTQQYGVAYIVSQRSYSGLQLNRKLGVVVCHGYNCWPHCWWICAVFRAIMALGVSTSKLNGYALTNANILASGSN